ncbi:MAG: ABC transporter permease [Candidatus Omnitrophica bacterium]|nr:ABC transporter permease [Candidatus Omnitrophota bacterium]
MLQYVLKRFVIAIPLLFGATLVTFLVMHLTPGDPMAELRLNPQISPQTIEYYERTFHLNDSVIIQYSAWLKNLFQGDLGYSFSYQAPVKKLIASRAANTLLLSLSTIIVTWIFVIPLGVMAVLHRNRFVDRIISFFSYLGISIPSFFLAILILYLAYRTGVFPLGGMRSVHFEELSLMRKIVDILKHLAVPVLVLSCGSIAALQRIMRANLLEVLGSSYIVAARARGISRVRILYIHVLKNALNPMITIFGYQLSALLSGAALTEIILGWPGLGQIMLEAVRKQDIYLVMGSVLISGVFLIAGNLLADILLGVVDPRIRYTKTK